MFGIQNKSLSSDMNCAVDIRKVAQDVQLSPTHCECNGSYCEDNESCIFVLWNDHSLSSGLTNSNAKYKNKRDFNELNLRLL